MVSFVEPLSSVEQCLHLTRYFYFSSGTFITEEYCLTLGLIFPDILKLPSNLSLNGQWVGFRLVYVNWNITSRDHSLASCFFIS